MNTQVSLKEAAARSGMDAEDVLALLGASTSSLVDLDLLLGQRTSVESDLVVLERGVL